MLVASAEKAQQTRRRKNSHGVGFWYSNYMGFARHDIKPGMTLPEPGTLSPTAFLVEQDADTEIKPHFHIAGQFQVFVHGAGSIGKHEARNLSVYYTSAYAPYGPLRAGPNGLSFFTFRDGIDFGARYMPQSREELPKTSRKRRFAYGGPIEPLQSGSRRRIDRAEIPVLPSHPDGLCALLHRLPADDAVTGPAPDLGGGQFWLVLSGAGATSGSTVAASSCLFVSPTDPAVTMLAGEQGLEALVLQFPRRDGETAAPLH